MSAESWAIVTLISYAGITLVLIAKRLATYSRSLRESLFTAALRIYVPLMFGQRFRERCPWPADGAALIVSNHSSPTDPIMIHAASLAKRSSMQMRIVEWLTAREYCEMNGPVGLFCDIARCIPVSRSGRDMAAVREALRRAREGRLIGVFPEGGINDGRSLKEFQSGVAYLALSAKLPVYPVFIESAPRGETMLASFYTCSKSRVHFGDEVDLDAWRAVRRPSAADLNAATTCIRNAVAALAGHDIASR